MHKNHFYLFTMSVESICFASLTITPWGYKAGLVTPVQPTSSHTISLCSSASFAMDKERDRK
jgi:hypothetical protein